MFQLIYLTFTAPRADPVAFRVLTDQLKVALAHQDALPDTAFTQALDAALSQNHPRAQPMTAARVDQMNLDKSLAFYKDRFADASDFTFVFVGSFDLATMKPLVERYLGEPAGAPQERDREGRRHASAGRRRREAGQTRHRAEEPGQHRVHRAVPERRDASRGRPRDGGDAGRQPAEHAAGGTRRHIRRERRAALHEASDRGVPPDDQLRLRSRRARTASSRPRSS